jgi:RNA polymerase sigma-70 factor (ECF subfamily)
MRPMVRRARTEPIDRASQRVGADELRRRFAAGDTAAFEALIGPDLDRLYTFCAWLSRSPAEADDLVQDTLIRAIDRHSLYDPARPLRPWVFRIARNLWHGQLRSPWRRAATALAEWLGSDERTPEVLVATAEQDAAIRGVLRSLPPLYAEAVSLKHIEGLTYDEMVAITGAAEPALKQRVRRGMEMIRERLEKKYPELELAHKLAEEEP